MRIKNAWMRLAHVLAAANTFLLLTLLYVLVIVPIAVLFRAFGNSIIRRAGTGSTWSEHRGQSSLEKPF